MKIYGIPNCNTVKKALDWLKANSIDFEFHDFKKHGITETKLQDWADQVGWEALVNKRGTTWKKLDPLTQSEVVSAKAAFVVLQEKPSMIKRPVIESPEGLLLGFDEDTYKKAFHL
jgi:arsenate reductase